jgi:endonuclease/exonuclease/phosphatase family metal-dependent hydrolase
VLERLRAISKGAVVTANVAAVLLLIAAYVSTYVNPLTFPYAALFGIAYGPVLVVNLGFVLFWLLVKKRLALISFIAILIGINHLNAYFKLLPTRSAGQTAGTPLKVVSHNVRLFGWYNWRTNQADRDGMLAALAEAQADVYCFQEYFHNSTPAVFEVNEKVKKTLGTPHLHKVYGLTLHGDQHYGMAIASKYPIVGSGSIAFPHERGNGCIYADVKVGPDTVRIYNAHVASIRFSEKNYNFVEELQQNQKPSQAKEGLSIVRRMIRAWKRRAQHVALVVKHIDTSPHPVVLCGDLNDTPVSYTYRQFSTRLRDSFSAGGWGIGNTYRGTFPSFRIDYIFYDPLLGASQYTRYDESVSDHHPISVVLHLPGR